MIAHEDQRNRLPRKGFYYHVKCAVRLFARLRKDDSGATLIEYTVLLSFIAPAVILSISFVGNWVGDQWTLLDSELNPGPPAVVDTSNSGGGDDGDDGDDGHHHHSH